jgi:hypothetical protein
MASSGCIVAGIARTVRFFGLTHGFNSRSGTSGMPVTLVPLQLRTSSFHFEKIRPAKTVFLYRDRPPRGSRVHRQLPFMVFRTHIC